MGLLDSVRSGISGAVSQAKSAVTEVVHKVKEKAADVGHAASSAFDAKPATLPAAASAPVSANPAVAARSVINGAGGVQASFFSALKSSPKTPEQTQAAELIAKHRSLLTGVDHKKLAADMAALARKDPDGSAAVLKEVMEQTRSVNKDNVASEFTKAASPQELKALAGTEAGKGVLTEMAKQLRAGWDTREEQGLAKTLDQAVTAGEPSRKELALNAASAATYAATGQQVFNLNDPEQARQLIINSPQLDNLSSTRNDAVRCGGAALLNGMLLDGKPADNARAIGDVIAAIKEEGRPFDVKPEEAAALQKMKEGNLTPTQAAHLQELLVRVATTPRDADAAAKRLQPKFGRTDGINGSNAPAVASTLQELRTLGAFSNSKSVTFHGEANHWVVTVTPKNGSAQTANSFPGENGKGSVGSPPAKTDKLQHDVTLVNREDGKVQYTRTGLGNDGTPFIPADTGPRGGGETLDMNKFVLGLPLD